MRTLPEVKICKTVINQLSKRRWKAMPLVVIPVVHMVFLADLGKSD